MKNPNRQRPTPQIEPLEGMSPLGLNDPRKSREEIDKAERAEAIAEAQAEPLTAPQVDHPELFPDALADGDGQKMLF